MGAEKEIVELWLNSKGFFTIKDINAGSRVIDILAIRQSKQIKIVHVEVACYISGTIAAKKEELMKKFNNSGVTKKIKQTIKKHLKEEKEYEKSLITTIPGLNLESINVIGFDKVLFEYVKQLDKQYYSSNIMRTLQLVKFVLLANPEYAARIIGNEEQFKTLTHRSREKFIQKLFEQDVAKKVFSKRNNEVVMVELLRHSTLKSPERLAAALDKVLTKRTATKFLNTLMKQRKIKTAAKSKGKNKTLQHFVS